MSNLCVGRAKCERHGLYLLCWVLNDHSCHFILPLCWSSDPRGTEIIATGAACFSQCQKTVSLSDRSIERERSWRYRTWAFFAWNVSGAVKKSHIATITRLINSPCFQCSLTTVSSFFFFRFSSLTSDLWWTVKRLFPAVITEQRPVPSQASQECISGHPPGDRCPPAAIVVLTRMKKKCNEFRLQTIKLQLNYNLIKWATRWCSG